MEAAEIYADTRHRLADLIGGLTDHQLARPVPACPGSTVKAATRPRGSAPG